MKKAFQRFVGWSSGKRSRPMFVEQLEPRQLMAADIRVGAVYIEKDSGSDLEPDKFYVSFRGGAENTQLTRLVIDGDRFESGLGRGDMIFDIAIGGLGVDKAHGFKIETLQTRNPNASVKATVVDGSTRLVLDFSNFYAGDLLVFSIDVDEIDQMDPGDTNVDRINEGVDPIASGVEFQGTHFITEFSAPHYEVASGNSDFFNFYDRNLDPLELQLPRDDDGGRRDRTAGVGLTLKQVPKPVSLAGTVWVDSNEDLVIGATETRLSNVEIELFRKEGDQFVSTGFRTRTDSLGRYSFGSNLKLQPGIFQVRQVQPTGYYSVGATPGRLVGGGVVGQLIASDPNIISEIDLRLGDSHAIGLNFAENLPSILRGRVCYVVSGMDCTSEDSVKAPQANIQIDLLDSAGRVLSTTRTDSEGRYSFSNLRAGTYSVRQTNADGKIDGIAKAGSSGGRVNDPNTISQIILGGGVDAVDYNFCDLVPAEVSGHVYFDANNNGIRDQGEQSLPEVQVQLRDATGVILATQFTDALGFYAFTNLRPGIYQLIEQTPIGYLPGQASAGSLGGRTDSTGDVISQIPLGSGAKGINYDFGEILVSSISGFVYVDHNQDCQMQSDEPPIQGVLITLYNNAGVQVATTTTDATGAYRFDRLPAGRYTVRQSQPAGYLQGGQKAGSGGGDDSMQDVISQIDIAAGKDLVDYNFCELLPGSIAGTVFVDRDGDCQQDESERGLAGVRVELLDESGNLLRWTLTDSQGNYRFDGLIPGEYAVRELQPRGFFQGGQVAPPTGGDDSVEDLISQILVGSGQNIVEANFCEVEPARISGFVFQDGETLQTADGKLPSNVGELRDGQRTADDKPLANVILRLFDETGRPLLAAKTLEGSYSSEFVQTLTDASGFYEFVGLQPGIYYILQIQPDGYFDYIDTPGTTTGFALNSQQEIDDLRATTDIDLGAILDLSNGQLMDSILGVVVLPGQASQENNFSELLVELIPQVPPVETPPFVYSRPNVLPEIFPTLGPLPFEPLLWGPPPLILGSAGESAVTWHLSVINGGTPRGMRNGQELPEEEMVQNSEHLNFRNWTVRGMTSSNYRFVSLSPEARGKLSSVFYIPGAKPLMGDFNGDGFDELALFLDGEWFIDANGNGRWDEEDIWLKLGSKGDQPVVGDWDGDGKEDVGVFGPRWSGDQRALASEPGMPDPAHFVNTLRPKNVPRPPEETPDTPRLMQPSREGRARADVIDHVFRLGGDRDIAVSGQFNEDGGIATIGVFRNGTWRLDTTGDGKPNKTIEFGEKGDLPLVGDFVNQDGVDEIAIVRGNRVIVDSNHNGKIDATDLVFELESTEGTVIVGDFDGDGNDQPALYQTPEQQRSLQARRSAG